jgi:hypothetical protein
MSMLLRDRRGLVDMPLKLLVSVMIMVATAAAGFGALSQYSKVMVESNLRHQGESIASSALRLDGMGLNSSLKVQVKLDGAPMAGIEYFRVGYPLTVPLHPYAGMVRFKGAGTDEGHVYIKDIGGNILPLCSPEGATLSLGTGTYDVLMTKLHSRSANVTFVQVEVLK